MSKKTILTNGKGIVLVDEDIFEDLNKIKWWGMDKCTKAEQKENKHRIYAATKIKGK